MSTMTEEHTKPSLSLGRKPLKDKSDSNLGRQTLNDSLLIILGCWVLIGLIWYSLRDSNI